MEEESGQGFASGVCLGVESESGDQGWCESLSLRLDLR